MRDALNEIVKQTSNLFPFLMIDGTDTETEIKAMTPDRGLILRCIPKIPMPDLRGEVAVSDLSMLSGLLSFPSYNSDIATFEVTRKTRGSTDYAEKIEFGDGKKAGATFRLTNPSSIKEDDHPPSLNAINWDLEFEPSKSKITEFGQLAGLYSKSESLFTPTGEGGDLKFMLGEVSSSTHNASMIFQESVGSFNSDARYPISGFQSLMKLAGSNPLKLGVSSRGVMGVSIETSFASYFYVLRASK